MLAPPCSCARRRPALGSPGRSSPSSPPACSSTAACRHAHGGRPAPVLTPPTPRRLWSVCFLLAPFAEAVTGFGVGYIIALAGAAPPRPRRPAGAGARPLQPVAGAVGRARHRHDGRRHARRPDAQPARARLGAPAGADPRLLPAALLALRARRRVSPVARRRRSTTRPGPRCCSAWSGCSTSTATSRSPAPPRPRCCWPCASGATSGPTVRGSCAAAPSPTRPMSR